MTKLLMLSAALAVAACAGNPDTRAEPDPETSTTGVVEEDTSTTDVMPGQDDVHVQTGDTLDIPGDSALIERDVPDTTADDPYGYEPPEQDPSWQPADTTGQQVPPSDSALIERTYPDTTADTTEGLGEALDEWADSAAAERDSLR